MTANTSTLLKSGFILLRLMRVNSAEFSSFVVAERDEAYLESNVHCPPSRTFSSLHPPIRISCQNVSLLEKGWLRRRIVLFLGLAKLALAKPDQAKALLRPQIHPLAER